MAEKKRCPGCGDSFSVNKDGRLRSHEGDALADGRKCSQQRPVSDSAPTVKVMDDVKNNDDVAPKFEPCPDGCCEQLVSEDAKGPWFGAVYEGRCSVSECRIYEGDRIRADGQGGYECEDCGDDDAMDRHVRASLGVDPVSYQAQASAAAKRHLALAGMIPEGSRVTEVQDEVIIQLPVPAADEFLDPNEPEQSLNVSGQPPARYEWRGSQNLGYLVKDPATGDFRRYKNGNPKGWARATTFNKAASSTISLTDWSKRNVVIGASRRPDALVRAHGLTHETGRRELDRVVAELEEAAGAKVGADIGTYLHNFTELMDAGLKTWRDAPPQYQQQLKLYAEKLAQAGFEPVPGLIERTTLIQEFGGVAGTFDRVLFHRPSGVYVIGDLKTGKTMDYAREETFCQEWIYAHGVNEHGVYDWNTDTWRPVAHDLGVPNTMPPLIKVSEEIGLIIHMPVQGELAGQVILEEADLVKGREYAKLCYDVRSNVKPKRKLWSIVAPAQAVPEPTWEERFAGVRDPGQATALWKAAKANGVSGIRLEELIQAARNALTQRG